MIFSKDIKHILTLLKTNKLFLLAALGVGFAIFFSFSKGKLQEIPSNQLCIPAQSPFKYTISGIGFVEASSRNINVGVDVTGIVQNIFVKEGDIVKAGDPLLQLDPRLQKIQVQVRQSEVEALKSSVIASEASLAIAEDQYKRDQRLKAGVKSDQDLIASKYALNKSRAEVLVQKKKLEQAQNELAFAVLTLEKHYMRAPVEGMVLKIFTKKGEALSVFNTKPILTMGTHMPLHVRIQVDENDIWRYEKGAKAVAMLRSNSKKTYPLSFVKLEPLAISKTQLSGASEEKVDTRVMEIVYKLERSTQDHTKHQLMIGQIMDVFIETAEAG